MIINPYSNQQLLVPYPNTRILQETFGLVGTRIRDPFQSRRVWTISAVYAPILERAIGGLRVKLVDDKEFFSFANQMDLEVLLEVAKPGDRCKWSGKRYAEPGEPSFYGMCVDDDDLVDDLLDREMFLRAQSPTGVLSTQSEIVRRIHLEDRVDVEEYQLLLWDGDPETGMCPDYRMETLERRWARVERSRTPWEDV